MTGPFGNDRQERGRIVQLEEENDQLHHRVADLEATLGDIKRTLRRTEDLNIELAENNARRRGIEIAARLVVSTCIFKLGNVLGPDRRVLPHPLSHRLFMLQRELSR